MKRLGFLVTLAVLLLSSCATAPGNVAVPAVETGVDPETWAAIPAGTFLQGQHAHPNEVPYDYEMMVTPVTCAQYANFLNTALTAGDVKITDGAARGDYPGDVFHGYHHEREIAAGEWDYIVLDDPGLRINFDSATFMAASGYENHPMTMVSWFGAWGYCQFYGWRLPSDVEWEKAARGADDRPFPWGYEITPQNANFISSHDLFERTFEGAGGTTPVGFYNGKSYDGYATVDSPSP
jgi:formylglycine-generating enzyme required for sulfatase activity